MSATAERELNAIREAATDWVVQLGAEDLTPAQSADFIAWLRRSPVHVAEYLEVEAAWQAMTGAAAHDVTAIHQIVRDSASLVDFPGRSRAVLTPPWHRKTIRMRHFGWAAAAAAVLVIGVISVIAGPALMQHLSPEAYSTQLGETRRVSLADGSTVELNTMSALRVEMSDSARDIFIERGEAFFKVAKDSVRPFRVHSAATVVRALGTEFNVYRRPDKTIVTVVEGRVAVSGPKSTNENPAAQTELLAGQRVVVPIRSLTPAPMTPSVVDASRAVAWREQRLIFENESVATAVAEFNRYNVRQLSVDDEALGAQRISGVFKADRPDALIDFLTKTGNVRATEQSRSTTVLSVEP